jgi:hypothetical protein
MKHVGIREFRDHATRYLAGDEALLIERNGTPIGCYWPLGGKADTAGFIPSRKGTKEARAAFERLERTLGAIYERTGMSEEDLAHYFDLSIPIEEL